MTKSILSTSFTKCFISPSCRTDYHPYLIVPDGIGKRFGHFAAMLEVQFL